ncbi:uncharacterized protein MONBRDRAFT_29592 [Monosiga brevicollis MX1]|uniref:Uncharacterized protein n=1 Tax=Monosiga brevicollis TaxID=81824 RepID=A9VBJ5_MONBE|nr:uncharacterized protein MONBRDRAFT_29592 [Monosiga brevicollis MX1]EDQ85073.1 predicted protein [Monosiga brevicollis MX1]|eukprot:XP_001750077.1 hypothetical protein [Monosiga brevicollis MX1]
MDLNLTPPAPTAVAPLVAAAAQVGYQGGAVNQVITTRISTDVNPDFSLDNLPVPSHGSAQSKRPFLPLRRATILLNDNSNSFALSGSFTGLSEFDILAVLPGTDKLFAQCTDKLEVDVISFDLTAKLPFRVKPTQIRQARQRGVYFELQYGPLLTADAATRRRVMSNAQQIVRMTKGRQILLTSGGSAPNVLRSAHDVANLGRLFGLTRDWRQPAPTALPKRSKSKPAQVPPKKAKESAAPPHSTTKGNSNAATPATPATVDGNPAQAKSAKRAKRAN